MTNLDQSYITFVGRESPGPHVLYIGQKMLQAICECVMAHGWGCIETGFSKLVFGNA